MIPLVRTLSELMAITTSRDLIKEASQDDKKDTPTLEYLQRGKHITSIVEKQIGLPHLPKKTRRKWIKSKEAVSKFFDGLDYNNQIQSSYDLTLIARQSKTNERDVA